MCLFPGKVIWQKVAIIFSSPRCAVRTNVSRFFDRDSYTRKSFVGKCFEKSKHCRLVDLTGERITFGQVLIAQYHYGGFSLVLAVNVVPRHICVAINCYGRPSNEPILPTFKRPIFLSYRNQSVDLESK